MQVRSYARAFPTDRRIYRIDRWTVPLPGGLPLAASAWFLALALLVGAIGQLPGARGVVELVGWPAAVLIAPGAGAVALTRRCEDGRTLPRLAGDRVLHRLRELHCDAQARTVELPPFLVAAGDLSLPGVARIVGPGRIRLDPAARVESAGDRVCIRTSDRPARATAAIVALAAGEVVEVGA